MIILLNNKPALLKSGSSFEYVTENRLFMGRDGYSLTLTFPIKDCPENRAIFGFMERMDVEKSELTFECEIRDRNIVLSGTLLVTGISQSEVKGQFSEGRCEQTVIDPFEDSYIDELDLGEYPALVASAISPSDAWMGIQYGKEEVALPWVNEAYPDPPNNDAIYNEGKYSWASHTSRLSWQPYLIVIAKRICVASGYSFDFSEWEQSDYRYLIICNTLPASWNIPQYNRVLPHWTVSEFFNKLELFLMGEFNMNHREKSISFEFSKTAIKNAVPVHIRQVIDAYTVDISMSEDDNCEYIGVKRLMYKECSHSMWNFYSCDWFLDGRNVQEYENVPLMLEKNKRRNVESNGQVRVYWGDPDFGGRGTNWVNGVLYARAEDTYFVFRSIGTELLHKQFPLDIYTQVYVLQPVNVFGCGYVDNEDRPCEEIEFVPPCIMDTDAAHGDMMFLSFSSYDEDAQDYYRPGNNRDPSKVVQPMPASSITAGEKEGKSEYYDVVYVGFWDGSVPNYGKMPYPMIDTVNVTQDWMYFSSHFADMRLYGKGHNIQTQIPKIDARKKYKFSFLSDDIPNPRAIFHIRGRRYVCEKITATFTENGMSNLLKGEFYPLADD